MLKLLPLILAKATNHGQVFFSCDATLTSNGRALLRGGNPSLGGSPPFTGRLGPPVRVPALRPGRRGHEVDGALAVAGTLDAVLTALSPLRRRLLLSVAALVLVGAVVIVAAAVRGRTSNVPSAQVQQSQPGPVLLVPGYGGSTDALGVLAARLRQAGRDATVVALPGSGTGDLTAQARVLGAAVAAARTRTGSGSVDVVGYSAGGVVTRIWAADLGGAAQARRIVTLGSPHHGTEIAGLAAGLLPSQCPTACQQLAPDSPVLAALNRGDETPNGPEWVSLWTTADQVVTPPSSASLQGAIDIPVQSVCASSTVDHGNLPRDPLVGAIVAAELGSGPTVRLGAGDCARLSVTP